MHVCAVHFKCSLDIFEISYKKKIKKKFKKIKKRNKKKYILKKYKK